MMRRLLPHLLTLAFMLAFIGLGLGFVWLAWGNNSCGWDGGSFDCPMTHPAWDVAGWIAAGLGLLATRNVAREAWSVLARRPEPQEASANDPRSGR